jgi:hypothetical protein
VIAFVLRGEAAEPPAPDGSPQRPARARPARRGAKKPEPARG